jgi:DNA-binding transcriptional LysR family regulator
MDKLKALQAFVAIVERGSLTAAAEALDSSLPAVVRTLAALESQVGVRLLNRTTRRLSLTEDGRQYLERAKRILADLDDADRSVGARQAEPSGALRVTAPVLFGQYHVAPAVTRFVQRYPKMHVELVLLDRVVNLVEEGLDVGVRIGPQQDSTVIARGVGRIRHVVVASPALLRRLGTPKHPRELARLPCLRFSATEGGPWAFREAGRAFTVSVQRGPLDCNLAAPLLEACAAGLGFVRCLSYQAGSLLAAKQLRIVLGDYEVEPWPVCLTYPSARLLPLRTKLFIESMVDELKSSV